MPEGTVPGLTVIIPAWNEGKNLARLLPLLDRTLSSLDAGYEIIVADYASQDETAQVCADQGARCLNVREQGYGRALRAGVAAARGEFVITMDADLSHPSDFIRVLWENRRVADVVIASRYVTGGRAEMPFSRRILSGILNRVFALVLSIPVRDLSSGFRLYHRAVLEEIEPTGRDFNILQEILIKAYALGFRVAEVPFTYRRRGSGVSHARLLAFAVQYLKTLGSMWRLRNSIDTGDYDQRAYDSRLPPQRWWQRKRCRIILEWAAAGGPALDVGCGASRILDGLPGGSLGIDPLVPKLRYARRFGKYVAAGALPRIPVGDGLFGTVICSQVIEHIPADGAIFAELRRLVAPGGQLILGTPDYKRLRWRVMEKVYDFVNPGGYADEHITHYNAALLEALLAEAGFEVREKRYIGGGELILRCRRSS